MPPEFWKLKTPRQVFPSKCSTAPSVPTVRISVPPAGPPAPSQNRTWFDGACVDAVFTNRDYEPTAIARKAIRRKTGARGLRTILEQVLLDTMFNLPSLEHVSKVVVDEAVINGQAEPYLIYRGNMQNRAASE